MNTEIRVLTPDLADDFLDFFDRDAFSDHPEWSWCYCLYYHFDDSDAPERDKLDKAGIRAQAAEYISDGRMQGYLLYVDGKPAARLVDRVCTDAADSGYTGVEAYPADEGSDCFGQYHGHLAMYLKNGFHKNKECNGFTIVRKEV